jgi:Asp-tRNA(Asn)/Glu-tRNA(Gln) amidotransferase C subunit
LCDVKLDDVSEESFHEAIEYNSATTRADEQVMSDKEARELKEKLLKNAPSTYRSFYAVPKIKE